MRLYSVTIANTTVRSDIELVIVVTLGFFLLKLT